MAEVDGEVSDHGDHGDVAWPEEGRLAQRWEARLCLRERMRSEHKLLLWPCKKMVGAASIPALCLNRFAIADILLEWCPCSSEPKSPPIEWLRREARSPKALHHSMRGPQYTSVGS